MLKLNKAQATSHGTKNNMTHTQSRKGTPFRGIRSGQVAGYNQTHTHVQKKGTMFVSSRRTVQNNTHQKKSTSKVFYIMYDMIRQKRTTPRTKKKKLSHNIGQNLTNGYGKPSERERAMSIIPDNSEFTILPVVL